MRTKPTLRVWLLTIPALFSQTLSADITLTGSASVTVTDAASIHFVGSALRINDTAHFRIQGGGNLTGSAVLIAPLAKLSNCGTVNALVVNEGAVVADCGGTSTFLASVTNNGVFRVSHGSTLVVAGNFLNNGGALLDLITATQTGPPIQFSNAGMVVEAKDVHVTQILAGPVNAHYSVTLN